MLFKFGQNVRFSNYPSYLFTYNRLHLWMRPKQNFFANTLCPALRLLTKFR